jgi:hypothetical protein
VSTACCALDTSAARTPPAARTRAPAGAAGPARQRRGRDLAGRGQTGHDHVDRHRDDRRRCADTTTSETIERLCSQSITRTTYPSGTERSRRAPVASGRRRSLSGVSRQSDGPIRSAGRSRGRRRSGREAAGGDDRRARSDSARGFSATAPSRCPGFELVSVGYASFLSVKRNRRADPSLVRKGSTMSSGRLTRPRGASGVASATKGHIKPSAGSSKLELSGSGHREQSRPLHLAPSLSLGRLLARRQRAELRSSIEVSPHLLVIVARCSHVQVHRPPPCVQLANTPARRPRRFCLSVPLP